MTVAAADGRAIAAAASPEAALIERARAMEPAAWDELYSMHYPAIHRYCAYRLARADTAEDIAADVFLEAVRGIARYRYTGTPFRAWLYRIAHNLTADERRRRARDAVSAAALPLETASDPDIAAGVVDRRAIEAALHALTEDQQQVIILRFFEGLPVRDVAAIIGKPEGAVKALQHRAMARLRTLLEGEGR